MGFLFLVVVFDFGLRCVPHESGEERLRFWVFFWAFASLACRHRVRLVTVSVMHFPIHIVYMCVLGARGSNLPRIVEVCLSLGVLLVICLALESETALLECCHCASSSS